MTCLSSKPAVDGLERILQGQVLVFRINIRDQVGREVARRYRVSATPTFIVFDGLGIEVHRQSGGFPDIDRLKSEALGSSRQSK